MSEHRQPESQETFRRKCMDQIATDHEPYHIIIYDEVTKHRYIMRRQTYEESLSLQEEAGWMGLDAKVLLEVRPPYIPSEQTVKQRESLRRNRDDK